MRVVAALDPDALVCEDVTRRLAHDEQRGGHEGGEGAEALTAGGGVRARAVGGFSCEYPADQNHERQGDEKADRVAHRAG